MRDWILPLHRFLTDPDKELVVDHKNHCVWDNRSKNLRICTLQQNSWNASPSKNKRSRFKGVSLKRRGKNPEWTATFKGQLVGTFREEEYAAYAWNVLAKKHYGEFAYQNEVVLSVDEISNVIAVIEHTEFKRGQRKKYWAAQPKVERKGDHLVPKSAHDLTSLSEN